MFDLPEKVVTTIGLAAGFMTAFSFWPQLIKVWKTRSTHDVSFWTFGILWGGIFLWFVYGLLIGDVPMIAANGLSLVLIGCILSFKIRYR